MNLDEKINIVKDILHDKKVAIGFSGGADSTLLVYLASKYAKDTLAITIDNHILPEGFIENTIQAAKSFGVKHEIININFYENDTFLANNEKRCYNCRNLMYSEIEKMACEKGFDFICDGNNISDLVKDRPGILVTYKNEFNTPFIKAKLTSKEIHEYLNKNSIPFSRSTTCLATRIPTNTAATQEKIERISYCENYILSNTSCEIVKVRDFGKHGIIEVDNIDEILSNGEYKRINDELKHRGFEKVALNLTSIDDDEYISIDYHEGSFSYQLPFTINLETTQEQLDVDYHKSSEKIELENISIYETGFIEGNDFENYESALDTFMEILPKLRRNI